MGFDSKEINAIIAATKLLKEDNVAKAEEIIATDFPFKPIENQGRNYTLTQMMDVFFRDGFIDRYSGQRLIHPGMLRVMSELMPNEFPYQPHGKTDECHIAYWYYLPSVDHLVPIAKGGKDEMDNWVTTSTIRNMAKGIFSLDDLGWTLSPCGDIREWDGLSKDYVELVDKHPELKAIPRVKSWYGVTVKKLT